MADKVRANVEETIQKLSYFNDKKIFSVEEIAEIIRQSEKIEYRLIKNSSTKIEFLEAI